TGEPSVCDGICGDSLILGTETCDDGNTDALDGCNSSCQEEAGWNCDGAEPTDCTEICPDGLVVGYEECDDDNSTNNDGCDDTCLVEDYWTCDTSEPSICTCTDDLACEENYQCTSGVCEEYIGGSCPGFVVDSNQYLDSGDTTTANISNQYDGYDGDDGKGNDVFYQVYLTAGEFLYASVYNTPGWNPVLVLLNSCYTGGNNVDAANIIEYANYNGSDQVEQIHFVASADGTYIIVVDGQDGGDNGSFNVEIVHGTAGAPDSTSNLIINEVLVNAHGSGRHEWIEIYNDDGVDYNLNGVTLSTDSDNELIDDDVIILANSFIVIANDLNANDLDGDVDVCAWAWNSNGIFDNDNDTIELLDSSNNLIDAFYYNYSFSDRETANLDPGSKSKTGNDTWANWCVLDSDNDEHTPGYENNTCP
nr:DUF4215 domain-containing protein [Deltaproteobacteria bacterium]